jgi:hypothetical protein
VGRNDGDTAVQYNSAYWKCGILPLILSSTSDRIMFWWAHKHIANKYARNARLFLCLRN